MRSDIATHFIQTLEELTPELAQRLRQGTREEGFKGSGDLPNFFRRAFGPGWALVGDAGHFKDPALAHGMSDAFHDAELLSEAVAHGLSGEEPMLEALTRYEQERDAYALPLYEMNSQMARLQPPLPEMLQLFQAMQGNQAQIKRYIAAVGGSISPTEFFAPANIAEIMGSAAAKS